MSDEVRGDAHSGPSHTCGRSRGRASLIAVFAADRHHGSIQAGIGWGDEGPKAGFFPFYVGLAILISSVGQSGPRPHGARARDLFAEWRQLRQVLSVVIPTTIYVGVIPWIGIYVSSTHLHGILHAMARQVRLGRRCRDRDRHAAGCVLRVRKWFLVAACPRARSRHWLDL